MTDNLTNRHTAFQVIAEMWLRGEFPELEKDDPKYKMVVTFASYVDMMANRAEKKKKGINVKKG